MFERYGFQRVALLDGGLAGWKQAGKKIQRGRQNTTLQSNLTTNKINLNNQVIADKAFIKKVLLDKNFRIIDNRIRKRIRWNHALWFAKRWTYSKRNSYSLA